MKRANFVTIPEFKKTHGVHITTGHTGKMTGFLSLSTSSMCNSFCQARRNCPGSICQKCFAAPMLKMYKDLNAALIRNFEILTTEEIPAMEWPVLNTRFFRLESFGDVQNVVQVKNYFNFCRRNPQTNFTIWTKNPQIIAAALQECRKPANLIIVLSSHMLNTIASAENFSFVDKIFTVWSSEEKAAENGVKINCGARQCLTCLNCYQKRGPRYIHELIK